MLAGLGATVVGLHGMLRFPLRLPGHHGVEWMALLLSGRLLSRFRWAASVSSLAASATSILPIWGFHDPFLALIYLIPGIVIDLAYVGDDRVRANVWLLAALAGLAHACKPVARFLIVLIAGLPYDSLLSGLAYPLATHIAFGALGGFVGAGLVTMSRNFRKP